VLLLIANIGRNYSVFKCGCPDISGESYLKMARDLGANASLIKPFDIDDLVAEVNRLLGNNNSPRQAKQDITIK